MKKVLFIGMTPNKGGLETFMINVFTKLEGHGFHFEFLNPYSKKIAYTNFIIHKGGTIRNIKLNKSHVGYLSRFYSAKKFFLKYNYYDIVHLNTVSLNNLYWLKAANIYGIPKLIIHSHDYKFKHNSKVVDFCSKILSKYNQHYLKKNNIVELAVSDKSGKWMFNNNKFKVIKNGIDTNLYSPNKEMRIKLRKNLNISLKNKVLISVSKLTYQKNYYKILNIFNLIHKNDPSTNLIIAGDGEEKEDLINFTKRLNINDSVIFLGSINNVNELLNIADIMIMPSRYEGFPFSLVESQAVGISGLVSLEAVPEESNITGKLKYLSLKDSDDIWANKALYMLNKNNNFDKRDYMNNIVKRSKYDINSLSSQIKKIYFF